MAAEAPEEVEVALVAVAAVVEVASEVVVVEGAAVVSAHQEEGVSREVVVVEHREEGAVDSVVVVGGAATDFVYIARHCAPQSTHLFRPSQLGSPLTAFPIRFVRLLAP